VGDPGAYERAQLAGIEHLLSISAEQQAAYAREHPPTVPLPALPEAPGLASGDQLAALEAEVSAGRPPVAKARRLRLFPLPRNARGRAA